MDANCTQREFKSVQKMSQLNDTRQKVENLWTYKQSEDKSKGGAPWADSTC